MLNSTVPLVLPGRSSDDDFTLDWCVITPILLLGHFTSFLMSASCSKHLSRPLLRLIQPHTEQYPLKTGSAPPSAPKHPTGGTARHRVEEQDNRTASSSVTHGVLGSSSLQQTQGLVASDNKDVIEYTIHMNIHSCLIYLYN